MKLGLWLPILLTASGSALPAQAVEAEDFRTEIRQLREQIDRLELRLLEKNLPPTLASPANPTVVDETVSAASGPVTRAALPLDISGYFASTGIKTGLTGPFASYQTHSASIFLGKVLGNWSFHSELEFNYDPPLENGGIPVGPSVGGPEIETAWLNYKQQDWLNLRAGMLFVPTYWRLHHYSFTAMTVQAPFMYETIIPPTVAGVMVHGSKYFEDKGFTYSVYMGQGREYLDLHHNSRAAVGASILAHLPNSFWFDTLDLGVHHYQDRIDEGRRSVWGLETRIEQRRFGLLAEFARSRIGSGKDQSHLRGLYLQPAVRLAGQLYAVYRYDRIAGTGDSPHQRHTLGALFRPIPSVALKVEYNHYPAELTLPARNGLAAGVSFFVQ